MPWNNGDSRGFDSSLLRRQLYGQQKGATW
ncbi:hypothetical protein GQ607_010409 [Colletotrichum asianum]|uniref:Uncharacterized protein n=1 Tax=Colletotrichum asianum TaxID=702518 RepID=A0A8H3ZK76_9PEZI|nr:hypothetical protein GQ607_010409 [Colletotrichum asianum]